MAGFPYRRRVIQFLRFIGTLNAAIWLGAALFFTVAVGPAFFSPAMKRLLGDVYAGLAAQIVLERYFVLHFLCGGLAIMHALAEWVYLGRNMQRWMIATLVAVLGLSLIGGLWLQPRLKRMHQVKYARPGYFSAEQQTQAARSFRTWHGISQVMNLVVIAGVAAYFWRITSLDTGTRFVSAAKFRG